MWFLYYNNNNNNDNNNNDNNNNNNNNNIIIIAALQNAFQNILYHEQRSHASWVNINIGFPGQFRRFVIPFDEEVIQIRLKNLGHEIRSSNLYFGH